jgi:CTP:molybdopterin cytidylyltransferase MocA
VVNGRQDSRRTAPRFAGLILAGGEGRRWGGPKALARLPDGRTFLEACREMLAEAGAQPVAATLPPATDAVAGLRCLPLPTAGLDMLASLRWGLRHLVELPEWRAVVALPVDHPLVAADTVAALVAAGAPAAIPVHGGKHGHPVCLGRALVEGLARGEPGGATLRDLLRAAGAVAVAVDDPGIHANCNTPEALELHWRARCGGSGSRA